ncbi:hypothetical protein Q9L58_010654 [Maublancomyces gigas]|uniref:Uncharacterized protein n=1 Tax=Discina gigas TaxID=1032678 RepID=A0ABR3G3Q6_9PEZI
MPVRPPSGLDLYLTQCTAGFGPPNTPGPNVTKRTLTRSQLASQKAAVGRQRLVKLLDRLQGGCSACWVAGLPHGHPYAGCNTSYQRRVSLSFLLDFRQGMRFELGAACYRCYLPMAFCQKADLGGGKDCLYRDILLPAFISALEEPSIERKLKVFMGLQGRANTEEIKHWLSEKVTRDGRQLSNLWLAFEQILFHVEGSEAG